MKEKWHQKNWWVSKYDFSENVINDFSLPEKVEFHDSTLRDGEQTPGVVFRKAEKVDIARKLADIGIDRIEAGMPAVSKDDEEAIKEISKLNLSSKIMAFSRARKEDIDKAVDCGVWGIVLEVPSGYPKLKYQYSKWTEEELFERSINSINYAKKQGLFVNFFPFDTTRANLTFLKRFLKEVTDNSRPDSITVVDTTGSILPSALHYLIKEIKKIVNLPLEIHTHNDFGMATATTVAAVEEGISVVHGCINGLGERTGNAPLEEIALVLKILYGIDVKIDLKRISEVSQFVEKISKQKIARNKPVVGDLPFTREIGLGMKVLEKTPLAIFPYSPDFVGKKLNIVLGKKSGKESVEMKVKEAGFKANEEQIKTIVDLTKEKGIQKKDILTKDEFLEIVKKVIHN